MNKQVGSRKKN